MTYQIITEYLQKASNSNSAKVEVRRRFKDVVALDKQLRLIYKGYFIPPRPEKHVFSRNKFENYFIELRQGEIQKYLNKVASHPHL